MASRGCAVSVYKDNKGAPEENAAPTKSLDFSHISTQIVLNPRTDEFGGIKSAVIGSNFSCRLHAVSRTVPGADRLVSNQ